ncbi:hypothetical protein THASP1DRAFT_17256, partial [Thamnocephalis sphaerospora]
GHSWVEGDEPFHSRDSNAFGPVPDGLIEARVQWILWPLSRFGPVPERETSWTAKRVQCVQLPEKKVERQSSRALWSRPHRPRHEELGIDWQKSKAVLLHESMMVHASDQSS